MIQIFAGIIAEGPTDIRFLKPILEKAIIAVALDCRKQFEIEVFEIEIEKSGKTFKEQVQAAVRTGVENYAISILFIHADADDSDNRNVYKFKIDPITATLSDNPSNPKLVAVVPIQELESWMLADKDLLKRELGTLLSDKTLGINKFPESFSDPKSIIENAIRISRMHLTNKRRSKLSIADLYLPIGTSLELSDLNKLPSFQDFMNNLKSAFLELNLLEK